MGEIGIVQSTERTTSDDGTNGTNVVVDTGGGALVTAEHYADSGDDSLPLPGDFAELEDAPGTGAKKITGYIDPLSAKSAEPGGKRMYSRSAPGVVAAEFHMHPDGTSTLEIFTGMPLTIRSAGPVIIDSPDVRLGRGAGRAIACVGDFVAVRVPTLTCVAPGGPAVPVPPTAIAADGSYTATGQIISGCVASKGG